MFRNRIAWAVLVALTILPLVGCASRRRCCNETSYAARPVIATAPPCNNCP